MPIVIGSSIYLFVGLIQKQPLECSAVSSTPERRGITTLPCEQPVEPNCERRYPFAPEARSCLLIHTYKLHILPTEICLTVCMSLAQPPLLYHMPAGLSSRSGVLRTSVGRARWPMIQLLPLCCMGLRSCQMNLTMMGQRFLYNQATIGPILFNPGRPIQRRRHSLGHPRQPSFGSRVSACRPANPWNVLALPC